MDPLHIFFMCFQKLYISKILQGLSKGEGHIKQKQKRSGKKLFKGAVLPAKMPLC